jgi:hypothetical protein
MRVAAEGTLTICGVQLSTLPVEEIVKRRKASIITGSLGCNPGHAGIGDIICGRVAARTESERKAASK